MTRDIDNLLESLKKIEKKVVRTSEEIEEVKYKLKANAEIFERQILALWGMAFFFSILCCEWLAAIVVSAIAFILFFVVERL